MIPLYDVNEQTGGLEILANTNTEQVQAELIKRYPYLAEHNDDWVLLDGSDQM